MKIKEKNNYYYIYNVLHIVYKKDVEKGNNKSMNE